MSQHTEQPWRLQPPSQPFPGLCFLSQLYYGRVPVCVSLCSSQVRRLSLAHAPRSGWSEDSQSSPTYLNSLPTHTHICTHVHTHTIHPSVGSLTILFVFQCLTHVCSLSCQTASSLQAETKRTLCSEHLERCQSSRVAPGMFVKLD